MPPASAVTPTTEGASRYVGGNPENLKPRFRSGLWRRDQLDALADGFENLTRRRALPLDAHRVGDPVLAPGQQRVLLVRLPADPRQPRFTRRAMAQRAPLRGVRDRVRSFIEAGDELT